MVQTVDFFTPIVDDPYIYGQIAATNSLSDIYAMGGRPVTAMNVVGMPEDVIGLDVIHEILRGGADKVLEAECALAGGHSIKNPEPIYGLSVTGLVNPSRMITNAGAKPGDVLILTKPLGTGIITTGVKRGITSGEIVMRAIDIMSRLNTPGKKIAERGLVKCATDVTGFGLLGHLISLCKSSKTRAILHTANIPVIDPEVTRLIEEEDCVPGGSHENFKTADKNVGWAEIIPQSMKYILSDAQTSGGLLLCVPEENVSEVMTILDDDASLTRAMIGRILTADEVGPLITVV